MPRVPSNRFVFPRYDPRTGFLPRPRSSSESFMPQATSQNPPWLQDLPESRTDQLRRPLDLTTLQAPTTPSMHSQGLLSTATPQYSQWLDSPMTAHAHTSRRPLSLSTAPSLDTFDLSRSRASSVASDRQSVASSSEAELQSWFDDLLGIEAQPSTSPTTAFGTGAPWSSNSMTSTRTDSSFDMLGQFQNRASSMVSDQSSVSSYSEADNMQGFFDDVLGTLQPQPSTSAPVIDTEAPWSPGSMPSSSAMPHARAQRKRRGRGRRQSNARTSRPIASGSGTVERLSESQYATVTNPTAASGPGFLSMSADWLPPPPHALPAFDPLYPSRSVRESSLASTTSAVDTQSDAPAPDAAVLTTQWTPLDPADFPVTTPEHQPVARASNGKVLCSCGRRFRIAIDLKRHLSSMARAGEFPCPVPGCCADVRYRRHGGIMTWLSRPDAVIRHIRDKAEKHHDAAHAAYYDYYDNAEMVAESIRLGETLGVL